MFDLLKIGKVPLIELLEIVDKEKSDIQEKYWIEFYKDCNLFNLIHNAYNLKNKDTYDIVKQSRIRKIYQYTYDGKFVKDWNSITEAANYYNLHSGNICTSAKGGVRMTGNFQWRYYKVEQLKINIPFKFKRKVYKYDLEGNFLEEFESVKLAVPNQTKLVYKCCSGGVKTLYGFRYTFEKYEKLLPLERIVRKDKGITRNKPYKPRKKSI